jgi:hypothetical protein
MVRQSEHTANEIAQAQTTDVVQHHDEHDEQTASKQLWGVGADDDADNQRDHHRGEGGQEGCHALRLLGKQLLKDKAEDDGQDDHLDDTEEHAEGIDMDTLMSFGRVKTTLKSCGSRVRPIPNITNPRKGVIQEVEIQLNDAGTMSAIAATTMTISAIYCEMKLQILLSMLCYPFLYFYLFSPLCY